jgi:hypothetical protein
LGGCGNAILPSSDKMVNIDKVLQVAPKEFHIAIAKFTSISLIYRVFKKKILYDSMSEAIVDEAILKQSNRSKVLDLTEEIPMYFVIFRFRITRGTIHFS